ncbi:MAG: type I restriction enzyme HsdR N-terminal domain-containing protein [Bacteroidetes bacterium]|nr:type I restriction enzyme HsdR N-terminal domain-containing protein [Bacteroidota bacterium]
MQEINLPGFSPLFKNSGQRKYIFDSFRKKFVTLTPEEWVRQHWAHYLLNNIGVPKGLIGIEVSLHANNMRKRADIVVFDKSQNPALIIECKAPGVQLTEQTCLQAANYNTVFKAKYLIVSNGLQHFLFAIDFENNVSMRLSELPHFENWQ